MQRINDILKDSEYLNCIDNIIKAEADRIYCRHDIAHFLDVSRIAYILSLEESLDINKEIIYAAGLLHDIGRWMEYEDGIDHSIASRTIAERILAGHDFTSAEINEIGIAIKGHRKGGMTSTLGDIIYRADKLSRNCFMCNAIRMCKRFQKEESAILLY